jgi:hypothetical protein
VYKDGAAVASDRRLDLVEPFATAADQRDGGAVGGEPATVCCPDPAAGSRHERDRLLERTRLYC